MTNTRLENFRVYLRALEPDDYKTSIRWRQDDELWASLLGRKYFVSEAYEKKWVEDKIFNSDKQIVLAICLKTNNQYIGNAYLNDIDWFNRSARSGRLIGDKQHRGAGLGQEATRLLLQHAFVDLGLNRVESRQLVGNEAALLSLLKRGYKHEGVMREAVFKNGRFRDVNLLSITQADFFARYPEVVQDT